jgi:hypothetical protein
MHPVSNHLTQGGRRRLGSTDSAFAVTLRLLPAPDSERYAPAVPSAFRRDKVLLELLRGNVGSIQSSYTGRKRSYRPRNNFPPFALSGNPTLTRSCHDRG